nr:hypothetical protein [uncultured Acetobacterium sp.]
MPDRKKKDIIAGTSLGKIKNKVKQKNITCGVRGVSQHSGNDKWVANINFQRKRIYLGLFDEFEDGIEAWKKPEEIYFQPVIEKHKNE